jgi:hypothetical protein
VGSEPLNSSHFLQSVSAPVCSRRPSGVVTHGREFNGGVVPDMLGVPAFKVSRPVIFFVLMESYDLPPHPAVLP